MNWRIFQSAAAALLLASATAAPAADADPRISVFPPRPDAGMLMRFEVEGEWPDACPPQIRDVRVSGYEIVLDAVAGAAVCTGGPKRYRIASGAALAERTRVVRNGVYRVRFEVRSEADAPARLYGFQLIYVGNTPDPGFVPETGFWWPEAGGEFADAGPGLGVQMEVQSRNLSVSVFGYDNDGRPGWLLGAGKIDGHVSGFDLSQLRGGSGPFDAYGAPTDIHTAGSLQIELLSPSRVNLWFVRDAGEGLGLEARAISMVRFRFAQQAEHAWLGHWVVLDESDERFPTQRIHFVSAQREENGFVLSDAAQSNLLRCQDAVGLPNSPPQRCLLSNSGGGVMQVDFDRIGLNELRGMTGAGQRVVALKLER